MTIALSFDANYYLSARPDVFNAFVATAGATGQTWAQFAEVHYNTFGRFEGSNPNSVFNTTEYLTANPDVAAAGVNPFQHFLSFGITEGRAPNATVPGSAAFDSAVYLAANADLGLAGITTPAAAYAHYLEFGQFESRPGTPAINTPGTTFVLTTGADAGAAFTGGANADTFVATETTLSSGDSIDGGAGVDILNYAASGAAAIVEAGFVSKNIEIINVTSDVGVAAGTTFDVTGTTGVTEINNNNSSVDLTIVGGAAIPTIGLISVGSAGAGAIDTDPDTTVIFDAPVVAGAADALNVNLSKNVNVDGSAIGDLTVNGIETVAITTSGGASLMSGVISGSLNGMTVAGDQNLTLGAQGFAAATNTLDASKLTGALNVTLTSTNVNDVAVTGGTGADTANFTPGGFDAGDSFDGGDGIDTLGIDNGTAILPVLGGTLKNVEILSVTTAGTGTIDMDNFVGVGTVNYDAGIVVGATTATVDDAVTGIVVGANMGAANAGAQLIVDLKVDGATDEVTVNLNKVGTADTFGNVNADDAETLNINVNDDPAVIGTGTLALGNLAANDATTVKLTSTANLTLAAATSVGITSFDASASTGTLGLVGLDFAAAGANIKLGAGADTFGSLATGATGAGADTVTLGAGADTIFYTALAQSAAAKVDTITDFVSGTDVINVTSLLGVGPTTANFVGTFSSFGAAQGAITLGGLTEAVFDSSTSTLWVDVNNDGTLNANDLQVILTGVTNLTAADLGLVGGVTFTANKAGFNTATAADSVEGNAVTNAADTINATVTQINNAGTVINGLLGTDILNVSGPGTADLTTGAFSNTETVNLANDTSGLIVNSSFVDGTANDIATIAGDAGKNQTLTINPFGVATADLKLTAVSNIENLAFGAAGEIRVDEDSFASVATVVGSVGADILELNGNAATDDFDFSGRILTQVETLDLVQARNVTLGAAQLAGGLTAITGAAAADLFLTSSVDLTPLAITGGAVDDITMTVNNTALTIDDTHDAGADFDDLIGQGSNDLIANTGGGAIVNIDTFTGFDTIDASGLADGQVLDIDDDATDTNYTINLGDSDLNMAGATSTDQVTVNQSGAAPATQSVETGNGNDTLNLTAATVLTVDANGGNDTINLGVNLTTADTIDGGTGTDTINVTNDTATTDLDNVVNVEVVNMTGANAFSYATVDANIAAGQSMTFNQSTGSGALTLDFALETDGSVNVQVGTGGSAITFASNNLVDTFTLGSGADALNLDANNTIANLANVDQVANFNQAGNDSLNVINANGATEEFYNINLGAGTTLASFLGDLNTALFGVVGYPAASATAGDSIIVQVAGGALAGTYAVSDTTAAAGVDGTAEIVQLTGTIGAITDADFI